MKKIVAPIIIVLVMLAYMAFILTLVLIESDTNELVGKIIAAAVVSLVAGALVTVLVQRIKEIRKGEESDLSKY